MKKKINKGIIKPYKNSSKKSDCILYRLIPSGAVVVALGLAIFGFGVGISLTNEKHLARNVETLFEDPKSVYSRALAEEEAISYDDYVSGKISRQEFENVFSYENKLKIVKEIGDKEAQGDVAKFENAVSNGEKVGIAGCAMVCGGFLISAVGAISSVKRKITEIASYDVSNEIICISDAPDESQHNMELID